MKKFNSLDSLKSLIPENYEFEVDNGINKIFKKQNLEAHYSIKGRSGKPVIIIKGFNGTKNEIIRQPIDPVKINVTTALSVNDSFLV